MIVDNLSYFGVGNVSRRLRAASFVRARIRLSTKKRAEGARAILVSHTKASAVTSHTNDNLLGLNANLGEHGEGIICLRLVDMGSKAIAALATGNSPLVVHISHCPCKSYVM